MKLRFILIILTYVFHAHLTGLPIRLINPEKEIVWIDSSVLRGTIGDTGIAEFEKKEYFEIDAPHIVLQMLADIFTITRAAILTSASKENTKSQVAYYLTKQRKNVDIENMVYLVSVVQQYFPPNIQLGTLNAVAILAGDQDIDLSETDITLTNQMFFAVVQRVLQKPERSIILFLNQLKAQNRSLNVPPLQKTLGLVGTWLNENIGYTLRSIIGINEIIKRLPQIDSINLSYNELTFDEVDSYYMNEALKPIHRIQLSYNNLNMLPQGFLSGLENLRNLALDHNNLATLPNNFLSTNPLIQQVDLSHNQLTSLPENFLKDAKQLQKVDLSTNRLTELPQNFLLNAPETVKLYLADNNFTDDYLRDLPEKIQNAIQDIDFERKVKRKRDDSGEEPSGFETESKKAKGAD